MTTLYMTIGLPGSGKTYTHDKDYPNTIHISSDAIREEVFGDVNDQTHNSEVFDIMKKRTFASLRNGDSVYYDATNLSAKRRMAFLKEVKKSVSDIECIAILFAVPFEVCVKNNESRDRTVPYEVLFCMRERFDMVHYSEGFDDIRVIRDKATDYDIEKRICILEELSHNNPHHSASVGKHMLLAARYASESHFKSSIYDACYYHDIGKEFTKVFHDAKGNPTDIAHFYHHENVGAYEYLSKVEMIADAGYYIHVTNLIAHHMDFFKGEKYLEKIKTRFGKYFFADLELVHEADLAAH